MASMEEALLLFCTLFVLISCFLLFPPLYNKKLPPGPRRWPLVGNLPQISRQRPHADMADLARVHGPMLSLRLGTELVVVASSPAAAMEVLEIHDKNLASRQGTEVKIRELVFKTIFNVLGNVILSRDVFDEGKNVAASNGLKSTFSRILELGLAMNVADLYPALAMLDIQRLNREATKHHHMLCDIRDVFIEERKKDGRLEIEVRFLVNSALR